MEGRKQKGGDAKPEPLPKKTFYYTLIVFPAGQSKMLDLQRTGTIPLRFVVGWARSLECWKEISLIRSRNHWPRKSIHVSLTRLPAGLHTIGRCNWVALAFGYPQSRSGKWLVEVEYGASVAEQREEEP